MKNLQLENSVSEYIKPIKDEDGFNTSIEVSTEKVRLKKLDILSDATAQTPTASNHIATKQYVDDNSSSGISTHFWHVLIPGYRINNTSTTVYYTFYRNWFENWSNADSTPSSIAALDAVSAYYIAPRAGTITNVKLQGYAQDTGATDPFKFYFYKATLSAGAGSMTLTHMFDTAAITPSGTSKTFKYDLDISADNTFAEDDNLFVWLKKDSNSGNQDLYFNLVVNGEYA